MKKWVNVARGTEVDIRWLKVDCTDSISKSWRHENFSFCLKSAKYSGHTIPGIQYWVEKNTFGHEK